jgi:hypothetical protein
VKRAGGKKNVCKVVVGTTEEERPLRKTPGLNGKLILKVYLKLPRRENVDWIYLANGKDQGRLRV